MNSIKIHDVEIQYGSLMELDDRLEFFSGFNEGEQSQEYTSFLKHSKDKHTFLDIGSSYGAFGLTFAKMDDTKKVYCFDGSINAWLTLNQTIEVNKLTNIKCHRLLVGNTDGTVGVAYDKHQSLVNQMSGTSDLMMQMDTFCELFDITPDCMKIDTEGYEHKVLLGAMGIIATYKPTLFMEVHPKFLTYHGNTIYDVLNVFNTINYYAVDLYGNVIEDYKKYLEAETTDSNRTVWLPR